MGMCNILIRTTVIALPDYIIRILHITVKNLHELNFTAYRMNNSIPVTI